MAKKKRKVRKQAKARASAKASANRTTLEVPEVTAAPVQGAESGVFLSAAGAEPYWPEAEADSDVSATDVRVVEGLVTALVEQLLVEPLLAGDHRHHTRVALEAEIDLASESHFFSGLSGDLSEGGLFVETYRDVQVGSEVAVAFSLPNGAVKAQGTVRWRRLASDSSPPGVGIAFDDLSDEDKGLIHSFCAARAPLYYDVDHAS